MSRENSLIQEITKSYQDKDLILEALAIAKEAHKEQKRFSGEDYFSHPLKVAQTLSNLGLDAKTIAAAFLHDTIDDTGLTLEEVEKKFGKEVAFLVDGVSKLGQIRLPKEFPEIQPIRERAKKPIDLQAENLRKMFFAMAKDLRVVLIKLADRLHNMETLSYVFKEKQKRLASETLEIFAPLANRLGIGEIKGRLEDLSFPYLYPKEYNWLIKNVEEKYEERKKYLENFQPIFKNLLKKEGIKIIDVHSRPKHYFSLYQKLLENEMDFERVYDLVALRVIVPDVKACYETLGIIHKHWRPLVGRIKDYIAFPKPNGYQSLHTTVFFERGKITEIQIRTPEMHQAAEYGICAHWAVKEKISFPIQEKKFAWVKELEGWQREILDQREFLDGLKIDFFKKRIFVFTPKGDVIDLPEGASPIDFAYSIHTDIGNHCAGARVNGKLIPVSHNLKNGDIVEILVNKNKNPSRDWLKFVKTSLARSRIRKEVKKSFLETLKETISPKKITETISPQRIVKLFPKKKAPPPPPVPISPEIKEIPQNVIIGGEAGIAFHLAKCCQPQPGDKIKAYITQSQNASIHKISCDNIKKSEKKWPDKIVEAIWS